MTNYYDDEIKIMDNEYFGGKNIKILGIDIGIGWKGLAYIVVLILSSIVVFYLMINNFNEGYRTDIEPHTHLFMDNTSAGWHEVYNDPDVSGKKNMYNLDNAYEDNHYYSM